MVALASLAGFTALQALRQQRRAHAAQARRAVAGQFWSRWELRVGRPMRPANAPVTAAMAKINRRRWPAPTVPPGGGARKSGRLHDGGSATAATPISAVVEVAAPGSSGPGVAGDLLARAGIAAVEMLAAVRIGAAVSAHRPRLHLQAGASAGRRCPSRSRRTVASRTLPRLWCHHMVSGCTTPRLSMLATFTPRGIAAPGHQLARAAVPPQGKRSRTHCSRRAVGVVVAGDEVLLAAGLRPCPRRFRTAGRARCGWSSNWRVARAVDAAAAGVVEVRVGTCRCPRRASGAAGGQVVRSDPGHHEAHADLTPRCRAACACRQLRRRKRLRGGGTCRAWRRCRPG